MNYKIVGGNTLKGSVTTNTSKNAAVALLAASLTNRGEAVIERMPHIQEVERLLEVLRSIGVDIEWNKKCIRLVPPQTFAVEHINVEAAQKTRSAFLFIGALVHMLDEFTFPAPGGCKLGSRTLTAHVSVLQDLGIELREQGDMFLVRNTKKAKEVISLYEASDTATNLALITAALIPQKTIIRFGSPNYMVQDLCVFLENMGVKIDGFGTSELTVHGLSNIEGTYTGSPSEDPIESMFFIALAATTHSKLEIKKCPIDFLELELMRLERMGLKFEISNEHVGENGRVRLVDITIYPSDLVALSEKIAAQPYPGINMDNLPFFVPIATQAKGRTFIHDWVYENRAIYYLELNKIGASIDFADLHRVFVNGPTVFQAAEVIAPPALRPATLLLIGMLAANGESLLRNVYPINRGYENLHERLKALGADIEAVDVI